MMLQKKSSTSRHQIAWMFVFATDKVKWLVGWLIVLAFSNITSNVSLSQTCPLWFFTKCKNALFYRDVWAFTAWPHSHCTHTCTCTTHRLWWKVLSLLVLSRITFTPTYHLRVRFTRRWDPPGGEKKRSDLSLYSMYLNIWSLDRKGILEIHLCWVFKWSDMQ